MTHPLLYSSKFMLIQVYMYVHYKKFKIIKGKRNAIIPFHIKAVPLLYVFLENLTKYIACKATLTISLIDFFGTGTQETTTKVSF